MCSSLLHNLLPHLGPAPILPPARESLWRLTNHARCQTKQLATSRFDHYCNGGYSRATDLEPENELKTSWGTSSWCHPTAVSPAPENRLVWRPASETVTGSPLWPSRTAAMKAAARNTARPTRVGFPSVSSFGTPRRNNGEEKENKQPGLTAGTYPQIPMSVIPSPANPRNGRSLFPLLYRPQSARYRFPALRRPTGSAQPSIPLLYPIAVNGYFAICYRKVPARFDGTLLSGETAPS